MRRSAVTVRPGLSILQPSSQLAERGQCATITPEEAPKRVYMTCNTRRRTVKGTHLLRSALLALLALAVISGASFAGGDLFDKGYKDCPHQARALTDGFISDMVVSRDSAEADHVDVSWAATEPSTWGLGANAYSTSLVVILEDADLNTKTLSLGTKKATFEEVDTGQEVTVQMAIVVDHADGKYLISDILSSDLNQSLTKPSFSTGWHRLKTIGDAATTTAEADAGFQYDSEEIKGGMMYYIGYNENFGNYKEGSFSITTSPSTARLRIGLAHSGTETAKQREDVKFEAYRIRIADSDNDVATVATSYGSTGTGDNKALNKLWLYDLDSGRPSFTDKGTIQTGEGSDAVDTGKALYNVRVVDGSKTMDPVYSLVDAHIDRPDSRSVKPMGVVNVKVGDREANEAGSDRTIGDIFANPPDEHRDFPIDTLPSDATYTIEAWAVNEDNEVISPKATLTVRPLDTTITLGGGNNGFQDYKNAENTTATASVIVTQFTVIK